MEEYNESDNPDPSDMEVSKHCYEILHMYRETEYSDIPGNDENYNNVRKGNLPHEKYETHKFTDFNYRGPLQHVKIQNPETPTIQINDCTYMRCQSGTTDYSEPTQEMLNDMPASRELFFDNGDFLGHMDRYIGNYENGLMHGPGNVTNIGGSLIIYYQGEFKDNRAVSTAKNVSIIYGGENLDNNKLASMTYTGEIINGNRSGNGTLTEMTNDGITKKYTGRWAFNKRNGKGSQSEDNQRYGKHHIKKITSGIWKDNSCYKNVMIEYPLTGMRFRRCYFKDIGEDEVMISAIVEMRSDIKKYIEYGKLELNISGIYTFTRSGMNTRKVYKNVTITQNGDLVNTEDNTFLLKNKSERRNTRRKVRINMVPEVSYVPTQYLPLDTSERGVNPITRSRSIKEITKNAARWSTRRSGKPRSVRGGRKQKRITRRNKI